MGNDIKKVETSRVAIIKDMLAEEKVKSKFEEVLGKQAAPFITTITNTVNASEGLQKCAPASVIAASVVAATFNLPVESNLGFSALVPYKSYKYVDGERQDQWLAQFQIMTRGFIQLAIRTGQYEKMNVSDVYEDELESFNPITGECKFVDDFSKTEQRENGETDKIVGYYAWYKLKTGFSKELYMTKKQVENHAKRYSQAYKYDLEKNKRNSLWSTDFGAMAKKTVLKSLLKGWSILSIEYLNPFEEDQKVYDEYGEGRYLDNKDVPKDVCKEDMGSPFEKANETVDVKEEDIRTVEEETNK